MLSYLGVKGFAIIDELRIEFGEGFNVINRGNGRGEVYSHQRPGDPHEREGHT